MTVITRQTRNVLEGLLVWTLALCLSWLIGAGLATGILRFYNWIH